MRGLSGVFFIWPKSNWRRAKHWYLPLFIKNLPYITAYTARTSIKSMSGTERTHASRSNRDRRMVIIAVWFFKSAWIPQDSLSTSSELFLPVPYSYNRRMNDETASCTDLTKSISSKRGKTKGKLWISSECRNGCNYRCWLEPYTRSCYILLLYQQKSTSGVTKWIPKNPLTNLCYTHCTDHSSSLKYVTLF